ncbi:MAG: lyase family protein, partial [Candidatus Nitrosopelagicus sp.]|nr:lyase family protein [Candidatus Nitrosopelagicus sp.]
MKYRSDRDSIGTVKIPADSYYGPFTGRAIKQYHVTGQKPHSYLIKSFVMIKRSSAVANMKTKALDSKRGNAIVKACDKILAGKYQDQFVVDMINSGAGTAFNMNTNEVIANVALKILGKKLGQYEFLHPNDHVNMSQSSNDTYPTAMNMSILFALNSLLPK